MNWLLRVVQQFAFIALVCNAAGRKQQSVSPENKLQQITELAAKAKGNVITLDDATYAYFAVNKPRPYSLVVFMTATHPKFKCTICKKIDSELALVASGYEDSLKQQQIAARGGEAPTRDVFFVKIDYGSSQKVFQNYQINSVPLLFHIPPQLGGSENDGKEYEIAPRNRFQFPSSGFPDAESIADFLRDRTGAAVHIKRSMIMSYIILLVLFGIVLALIQPVINSLPFWLRIIQSQNLWMVVSFGVYTCAISGLIFDIIRSPQMYYANPQTGQLMFVYPQQGNQFVVEGFIIGFLNLGCSAALIFVSSYAPYLRGGGTGANAASSDRNQRLMGMVLGIGFFIFCFRMVRSLYILKNPWYGR